MKEPDYTLFIDESGVSSDKLSFYAELEKRFFFGLASLKAQKEDIDEFYNEYLKQFEVNDEIKYKDLKKDKRKLHTILEIITEANFEIKIEFVESQLYYLMLFCNFVYYPFWLYDDEDVLEFRTNFFHEYSNYFDGVFFKLLDSLFIAQDLIQYEYAYNRLISFLINKKIMPEEALLRNLQETKEVINKGLYKYNDIKPFTKQHKKTEIIVLPHLQCLYNLIVQSNNVNTIIHDENLRYQGIFQEDIFINLNKNILFKNSKSESGLKVIDFVVSYCKNTIEYMIKNNDYTEISYINMFINKINFIINKKSQMELFANSDNDPSSIFKYFKSI